MLPVVDADRLTALLPMGDAIDALDAGFRLGVPEVPLRTAVATSSGTLLVMPAVGPTASGVKVVGLAPGNPERGLPFIHATYVLLDGATLAPRAILDGTALTALRTAAVSGLATRYLARQDAHRLVVVGAGVQARSHVAAIRAVRPITEIVVVSRTRERAEALAREVSDRDARGRVGVADDVGDADIVCTCTTSPTPVIDGSRLPEGVHVNAVGAYEPHTRELDTAAIVGSRVVVETREVAMAEAGALLIPIGEGVIGPDHVVADLAELVAGAAVRRSPSDRTVFLSEGFAFEDLLIAGAAAERL